MVMVMRVVVMWSWRAKRQVRVLRGVLSIDRRRWRIVGHDYRSGNVLNILHSISWMQQIWRRCCGGNKRSVIKVKSITKIFVVTSRRVQRTRLGTQVIGMSRSWLRIQKLSSWMLLLGRELLLLWVLMMLLLWLRLQVNGLPQLIGQTFVIFQLGHGFCNMCRKDQCSVIRFTISGLRGRGSG